MYYDWEGIKFGVKGAAFKLQVWAIVGWTEASGLKTLCKLNCVYGAMGDSEGLYVLFSSKLTFVKEAYG